MSDHVGPASTSTRPAWHDPGRPRGHGRRPPAHGDPENAAIARDAFEDHGIPVVGVADITFVCLDRTARGHRARSGGFHGRATEPARPCHAPEPWEGEVRSTPTRIGTQLQDIAQACTRIAGDIFRAGGR